MSKNRESSTEKFGSEVLQLIDAPPPEEKDDAETAEEPGDEEQQCSDS